MSEAKHTPGPWRVDERNDGSLSIVGLPTWPCNRYGVKGEWEIAALDDDEHPEEARANARLIAAAPDMLASLRQLADILGPRWFLENNIAGPLTAIAKAEGRS